MTRRFDIVTILKVILAGALAVALAGSLVWVVWTKTDLPQLFASSQEENRVTVMTVSSDTTERLSEGTVLTFGDPEKKHVTLIVDPAELSRETLLINGEPSALLSAVKDNRIFLNLYLTPSSEDRSPGTQSLIKTATCHLSTDNSSGKVITLVKLANAAPFFTGAEDMQKAAAIMNIKEKQTCPDSTDESTAGTFDNAEFFLQHFGTTKTTLLISEGQLIDNLTHLRDDFVERLAAGFPASQLLKEETLVEVK